jgi:hypothetical protein
MRFFQGKAFYSLALGTLIAGLFGLAASCSQGDHSPANQARLKFAISFPADRAASPLDGRLLLLISTDDKREPRFSINDSAGTSRFLE